MTVTGSGTGGWWCYPLLFAINTARFYTSTQSNSTARGGNTFRANKTFEKKATMGKNKQVSCNICYKTMRSDVVKRHMKVHEKTNKQICGELLDEIIDKVISTTKRKHDEDDNQSAAKRKCNEIDDDELEKMLEEITVEYDCKIALGKRIHKILEIGKVKVCALPKEDMWNNLMRKSLRLKMRKR